MYYDFFGDRMKKRKRKLLFCLFMILVGVIISYKKLNSTNIKLENKDIAYLITNYTFQEENTFIDDFIDKIIEKENPIKKMNQDYQKYVIKEKEEVIHTTSSPKIYLYNTHQTEEYASSNFIEYSIQPTVSMNDYILQDIFNKQGFPTIVEEESISKILKDNNWNYADSYKASRLLLEKRKEENPTLEYFIDIHRDSIGHDKTTITIDNKEYAKILFIVGLENPSYEENLKFTEKLHNKINEYYPNLSKGIYKKSGYGVNGIYNQDFSSNTILVEMGGYENTTNEVLNTTLAFAKCFLEVIHE